MIGFAAVASGAGMNEMSSSSMIWLAALAWVLIIVLVATNWPIERDEE